MPWVPCHTARPPLLLQNSLHELSLLLVTAVSFSILKNSNHTSVAPQLWTAMCPTGPKPRQTSVLIFLASGAALGPMNLSLLLEAIWSLHFRDIICGSPPSCAASSSPSLTFNTEIIPVFGGPFLFCWHLLLVIYFSSMALTIFSIATTSTFNQLTLEHQEF